MDRRGFLTHVLRAAAAITAVPTLTQARAATTELAVAPLADGLSCISGGGGNVTLFNSPAGALLVDGGSHEQAGQVLKAVRKLTGSARVHTLFNTHWHWDQTGSNAALGKAGTRIIAHENTRLWLGTDVNSKWEQRMYPRLPVNARPTQTTYTTGQLDFGGEQINYGYLPQAHTDGDLYVFFRKANVLVAGDVLAVGKYPIIDYCTGGWIGGMAAAVQTLTELANADTKIIPGTGPVQTRADLLAELDMLNLMKQRLSKLLAQGMSAQDMLDAAPTQDLNARWGDPTLFIANTWQGLVQRARELGVSIV